ncbi:hypothetical protein LP416_18640 [Polaromonas sp. P2-4]|nr:hypothetical protein LP416_18640 [Polaromonas sp. P2-4]
MNLPTFGNEGDDWIEIGTSDGAAGDNFAPLENSPVIGHDVIVTGGGFDEADGEGGHDIMVMSDGEDHFGGGGGFDWASYKNDPFGASVDMLVNDFIEPPVSASNQGILDRFAQVEGLTGSAFNDILRGDNADLAAINLAGTQNSTLDATGIALIANLQAFLDQALGGARRDFIQRRQHHPRRWRQRHHRGPRRRRPDRRRPLAERADCGDRPRACGRPTRSSPVSTA